MHMKVLLLFPMADGQTGPAIKYAFENLGFAVIAVDAKKHPGNSYQAALGFKPDLIFCSRTKTLTAQIVQIKKAFPASISCMWNVDTRSTIGEWAPLFPLFKAVDYHFVAASRLIPEWRKINEKTHWLPQGLQEEIYKKPAEITDEDRRKYECDVCFCGSIPSSGRYHRDRRPIIEAIRKTGFKLNIWGSEGKAQVYNEEHNKQTALAKISLGISGWPDGGKCVSVRDYKILGAGGFLLERCGDSLEDLLPLNGSGRILDCYNSEQSLIEKIGYWLANEDERKSVAERGYKWVHKKATYTHRIKMALNYMEM